MCRLTAECDAEPQREKVDEVDEVQVLCEGEMYGKSKACNGCNFERPKSEALEAEKALYNATSLTADTMCVSLPLSRSHTPYHLYLLL